MNGLDLFTGIGGITLALQEWVNPIAYCEIDTYCQSVLLQRMSEGNLPKAPIWDDIRTFPHLEEEIDIIYGGFPCQDISVAGAKKGLEGERSGLFFEILRIIDETKAPFIFLENVPNIRTKGAERVCKELAERGYDCRWCNVSASDVGARHKRQRWFLLAYSASMGRSERASEEIRFEEQETSGKNSSNVCETLPNTIVKGLEGQCITKRIQSKHPYISNACGWAVEPSMGRVVNGLPNRVDRIKALGNSVVPLQVREAFKILLGV